MYIDEIEQLHACIQNNRRCKYLSGYNLVIGMEFPLVVSCATGNECGRGMCCFYVEHYDYFEEKVNKFLELGGSLKKDSLYILLKEVARDQRYGCIEAYRKGDYYHDPVAENNIHNASIGEK